MDEKEAMDTLRFCAINSDCGGCPLQSVDDCHKDLALEAVSIIGRLMAKTRKLSAAHQEDCRRISRYNAQLNAALAYLKHGADNCDSCKHANNDRVCEDDCDCCASHCECYDCAKGEHWEWRGLTEDL
ncbi:MAG: hypothetical protein RR951_09430 [Ruthenibacterium sp.]